jgi:hypothetical protein
MQSPHRALKRHLLFLRFLSAAHLSPPFMRGHQQKRW